MIGQRAWIVWVVGPALALATLPLPAGARQQPARPPDIFYAPTREAVVYEMLELAGITPDDVVYDLGSGDGRIVVLAAQKYGVKGVGIEIEPKLVRVSRQVAREAGLDGKATFVEGDLFTADISPATIVTLYLSTSINRELEPKLRRELRPGTRIVSHQFPIGRWAPTRTIRSAEDGTNLYLWVVPTADSKIPFADQFVPTGPGARPGESQGQEIRAVTKSSRSSPS